MTDPMRKSIEALRGLAPRLNAATDDAGRVVQMIEKFLADECRLSLSAWVALDGEDDDDAAPPPAPMMATKSLGYARLAGRFRIVLREIGVSATAEPRTYAW